MHSSSLPMVSPCYRRCICGTPMLLDVDGVSMLLVVGTQHWSKLPPSQHGSLGLQAHSTGYSYHRHSTGPSYHRHSMAIKQFTPMLWPAYVINCYMAFFFPLFSPFPFFLSFHIILITILHHLGCSYKFHNWFPPPKTKKSVVPFLFTSLGNHNVCCFALSLFLLLCLPRQHK